MVTSATLFFYRPLGPLKLRPSLLSPLLFLFPPRSTCVHALPYPPSSYPSPLAIPPLGSTPLTPLAPTASRLKG